MRTGSVSVSVSYFRVVVNLNMHGILSVFRGLGSALCFVIHLTVSRTPWYHHCGPLLDKVDASGSSGG